MSRGKKNSLITVIIPTYNEENSVAWCLLSLSVQSNPHYEIVVIDDGSSDKTIQSIENLNDKVKNFRIFKQEHKGPGEARNLGAKHAKGEILVFIDADMTFDPNFLHELTEPILNQNSWQTLKTFGPSVGTLADFRLLESLVITTKHRWYRTHQTQEEFSEQY